VPSIAIEQPWLPALTIVDGGCDRSLGAWLMSRSLQLLFSQYRSFALALTLKIPQNVPPLRNA
jgi:hypothetical protein